MSRPRDPNSRRAAILALAHRCGSAGFLSDHPELHPLGDYRAVLNCIYNMQSRGVIFSVRVSYRRSRFFAHADWACAYANTITHAKAPAGADFSVPAALRPAGEPIVTERTKFTRCPGFVPRNVALDELLRQHIPAGVRIYGGHRRA